MIPSIVFDAASRPDLVELIRIHEHLPSGDVVVNWGAFKWSKSDSTLVVKFTKPTQMYILIDFDVSADSLLVELVLSSRALYIQGGTAKDTAEDRLNGKRLLIEIPSTGFEEFWRVKRYRHLKGVFREKGMSAQEVSNAIAVLDAQLAKLKDLRVAPPDELIDNQVILLKTKPD